MLALLKSIQITSNKQLIFYCLLALQANIMFAMALTNPEGSALIIRALRNVENVVGETLIGMP